MLWQQGKPYSYTENNTGGKAYPEMSQYTEQPGKVMGCDVALAPWLQFNKEES